MKPRYCVIIPVYNARATIGRLVAAVQQRNLPVIVVNDGSRDDTAKQCVAQGAVVISHLRNMGKGAALQTGFRYAIREGYDGVITMDGDGQHDPADLLTLIEAGERVHAQVIVGNRMGNHRAMPRLRRWTNRVMSLIVSRLTGQEVPDSQCGFRLIRTDVLREVRLVATHFDIETELLLVAARRGWTVHSVAITTIYANHHSHIRPIRDAVRFVQILCRYLLWR